MPEQPDHEQLSKRLEREADKLERQSEELGQHIHDTEAEWEAKRRDPKVAGATPPDDGEPPPEQEHPSEGDATPAD